MISTNYILTIFVLINLFFVFKFNKLSFLHYIIDKPDNYRKIHSKPTPLAGGIILIFNILIYFLIVNINREIFLNEIFFDSEFILSIFFTSALIIFFVGILDDKYNLSPNHKFIILSIIISITLNYDPNLMISSIKVSFLEINISLNKYSSFIFTYFCFMVFLNAFNMFDGINLQASTYSITIFLFIFILYSSALLIKVLLIYLMLYSYLNHKKKSFLGDSGSLLLAFIMGYIFIKLYNLEKIQYTDQVFIYMMIPGLDLIRVFFKRILNKQNPLHPDRQHIHHLLSSKFENIKCILIIQIMTIIPLLFSLFDFNKLIIILISILVYSICVYKLKN